MWTSIIVMGLLTMAIVIAGLINILILWTYQEPIVFIRDV